LTDNDAFQLLIDAVLSVLACANAILSFRALHLLRPGAIQVKPGDTLAAFLQRSSISEKLDVPACCKTKLRPLDDGV
jgi:hypothetical protein